MLVGPLLGSPLLVTPSLVSPCLVSRWRLRGLPQASWLVSPCLVSRWLVSRAWPQAERLAGKSFPGKPVGQIVWPCFGPAFFGQMLWPTLVADLSTVFKIGDDIETVWLWIPRVLPKHKHLPFLKFEVARVTLQQKLFVYSFFFLLCCFSLLLFFVCPSV